MNRLVWWVFFLGAAMIGGKELLQGPAQTPTDNQRVPAVVESTAAAVPAKLTGTLVYFRRSGSIGQIVKRDLATNKEQVVLADRLISEVTPSGEELLLVKRTKQQGEISRFDPLNQKAKVLLTVSNPGPQLLPRLSADGARLAFLAQGGALLEIVETNTGRSLAILELDEPVASVSWLGQELLLAIGSPPNFALAIYHPTKQSVTKLPGMTGGTIYTLDDNRALFASFDAANKQSSIARIDLTTKLSTVLTAGPFDDYPVQVGDKLLFHRLTGGSKRIDQIMLRFGGQETDLAIGLQPLLYID